MYRNEGGLFHVLEEILKTANRPMTASELFDNYPEVRALAASANRVSDYLGNMWRNKGVVQRLPAPKANNSSARFAYQWKTPSAAHPAPGAQTDPDSPNSFSKPGLTIEDKGNSVIIELENYIITIRKR